MNKTMMSENNIRENVVIRMTKAHWEKLISETADIVDEFNEKPIANRPDLSVKLNESDSCVGRGYVATYTPDGDDGVISIGIDPELMNITLKVVLKAAKILKPFYAATKALGTLLESVSGQFKELAAEMKAEYHTTFDKPHRYGVAHLGNQVANIDSYVVIVDDGYGNYAVPYELKLGKQEVPGESLHLWATKGALIRWLPEGATMESAKTEAKKMAQEIHPEYNPG